MPGILPMKVIKVGTSTQSRIAQACDRCRSKKIRCDGVRPTCSQCANVGFECRTSDKLSRRAFPRGYTESLEERVRALETEIRELKDLLDEKDEKIDMLSKMHGYRPQPQRTTSTGLSPSDPARLLDSPPKEDVFRVQASPLILDTENSDSYFMGASSGYAFIDPLRRKLQETGRHCSLLNPEYFFHIQGCKPLVANPAEHVKEMPPRLLADRAVNVFFQEWAPVFPVLHKPTFLQLYEEYVANPSKVKDSHKLATLYLVFSIAGYSGESPILGEVAACEYQWQPALENVIMQNTMTTLQCLILAIIYSMTRADYKRLQHYKAVAIGLSHRLGLHQSQKRFSFGALTLETRKRAFWTLYSLDCMSAAMIGLPKMLKEEDIECELPSDTDDEYITEKGYQPTLPGEYTRISSALALFRLSRILARVLEKIYPGSASHDLSLQLLWSLDGELSQWSENLPAHLRLNFTQDKPSTDVTGARSPILALAYYYIRALIHRPTVGSNLGTKAVPSLISLGESCKHIVQICELLEERRMSFTFCLNKNDLLVFCAMVLLYQSMELKGESKILKDVERLVYTVIRTLERRRAPESPQIERLSAAIIPSIQDTPSSAVSSENSQTPSSTMSPPPAKSPESTASSTNKDKRPLEYPVVFSNDSDQTNPGKARPRSSSQIPATAGPRPQSRACHGQTPAEQASRRDGRFSFSHIQQSMRRAWPNVDYLQISGSPTNPQPASPMDQQNLTPQPMPQQMYQSPQLQDKSANNGNPQIAEWETLIGSMDNGAMHNAIYGGHNHHIAEGPPTSAVSTATFSSWSPDTWDLANFNLGDLNANSAAHSVPSISDESLSSGEDLASSEMYASLGKEENPANMAQPPRTSQDGGELYLDALDLGFPLNLQC